MKGGTTFMSVAKVSVSLPAETLAMMEYLREHLGLSPTIKRSQLIQQIVFTAYTRAVALDQLDTSEH